MNKIFSLSILLACLLYADNNIIIEAQKQGSDTIGMIILGNGEACKVSMGSTGVLEGTDCLQITNSKGIKILCTPKKKMCKTLDELRVEMKDVPRSGSGKNDGIASLRQGMDYSKARQILFDAGWQGVNTRWQDIPKEGQLSDVYYNNGWTEAIDCAGTGMAPCRFEFNDINNRTLVVVTQGECFNSNFETLKKGETCELPVSNWFIE